MIKLKLLFSSYILSLIALFLYSFTQIDLSLTLSQVSFFQTLEKQFQYVGFFQRPLSALIFSLILFVLFISYFSFLYFAKKGYLNLKQIKILTILTFVSLVFSYNAFSYDLFNYIFDAKILTFYHQNPYFHKPLDYMQDPMLNFMRWTHRTYPYGPTWLFLTAPLSFVGMNYFLLTFFLYKILMGLSFLGSSYFIYKISEKLFPAQKLFNLCFWVFNPLVIIESLVSSHNDLPMIFLFLLSFYLFLQNKNIKSFVLYLLSIGVKYSTLALAPLFLYMSFMKTKKRKINYEKVFLAGLVLSLSTIVYAAFRTTFQPWYLLLPLTLATFISSNRWILISAVGASFFAVLIYLPYVYMTDYAPGYPNIIFNIELIGLIISVLPLLYFSIIKRIKFD